MITSKRLFLKSFKYGDNEFLYKLNNDRKVNKYLGTNQGNYTILIKIYIIVLINRFSLKLLNGSDLSVWADINVSFRVTIIIFRMVYMEKRKN
ncbi:hypothetical protein [Senegalia massiliensis]|uniref:hypothetical protein n=1 Tax=Senegalia massiliensis TaxID=1720316 RepID=UPI0013EF43F0|nr:hypothetical protein [Senegalia massiliensis]